MRSSPGFADSGPQSLAKRNIIFLLSAVSSAYKPVLCLMFTLSMETTVRGQDAISGLDSLFLLRSIKVTLTRPESIVLAVDI